jgi:hypothetical protein
VRVAKFGANKFIWLQRTNNYLRKYIERGQPANAAASRHKGAFTLRIAMERASAFSLIEAALA